MLIVTKAKNGRFECVKEGETGACIQGRGVSVLEAVGSWAVYSQTVQIRCDPPKLLDKFSVSPNTVIEFLQAPSRS